MTARSHYAPGPSPGTQYRQRNAARGGSFPLSAMGGG